MGYLDRINFKMNKINEANLSFKERLEACFNTKDITTNNNYIEHKDFINESLNHYNNIEANSNGDLNITDPKYYIGLVAKFSKIGKKLDPENLMTSAKVINDKIKEYKSLNWFKRTFSYLNPRKNIYRDLRNEIKYAKDLLVSKGIEKGEVNGIIKNADKYFDGSKVINTIQYDNYETTEKEILLDSVSEYIENANVNDDNKKDFEFLKEIYNEVNEEKKSWDRVDSISEITSDFMGLKNNNEALEEKDTLLDKLASIFGEPEEEDEEDDLELEEYDELTNSEKKIYDKLKGYEEEKAVKPTNDPFYKDIALDTELDKVDFNTKNEIISDEHGQIADGFDEEKDQAEENEIKEMINFNK